MTVILITAALVLALGVVSVIAMDIGISSVLSAFRRDTEVSAGSARPVALPQPSGPRHAWR